MKKSIVAMLSITALATVANADPFVTGTHFGYSVSGRTPGSSFKYTDSDDGQDTSFYWYAVTEDADTSFGVYTNSNLIGAGEYNAQCGRPAISDDPNNGTNLCLSVDTEGNRLYRSIFGRTASSEGVDDFQQTEVGANGFYFDSLVQFTVNEEDELNVQEDDKLAVWLHATTNGEDTVVTNLVITAGYVDDQGDVTRKDYKIEGMTINAGEWYRLTIEAIPLIEGAPSNKGYLGFRVRINGAYVTTNESKMDGSAEDCVGEMAAAGTAINVPSADMPKLFPSIVQGGQGTANCDKLSCVAFEGTGAVDDLTFTDTNPFSSAKPMVNNVEVDATNVFITARSNKPIVYPTAPTITTNGAGIVSIGFDGTSVEVPAWYDVSSSADGLTVNLTLNNTALPTIGTATVTVEGEPEAKEAIEVDATTFTATLTSTSTKLYYGLKVAASPNAAEWTAGELTQGTGAAMQISADKPKDGSDPLPAGFFKVYVTDIAPETPTP